MSRTPEIAAQHSKAARLQAIEVLLSDPEALQDDVLESALYILRDKLQSAEGCDANTL